MDTAKQITVIETTLTRRGDGKDAPIRCLTQYWNADGKLIAHVDPCGQEMTPERMEYLRQRLYNRLGQMADVEAVLEDVKEVLR